MKFNEIQETYHQQQIEKAKIALNSNKKYVLISACIGYPIFVLGLLSVMMNAYGTTIYVVGSIALTISWFVILFNIGMGIILIKVIYEYKQVKNLDKNGPVLEIQEDGRVFYQEAKRKQIKTIDTVMKIEPMILPNKDKFIRITGKHNGRIQTIDMIDGLKGLPVIKEILDVFVVMEQANTYDYSLFKDMLLRYKTSPDKIMKEIKNIDFLLSVNYYFDTKSVNQRVLVLPQGTTLSYQVETIDTKDYICLYTSYHEIPKDTEYLQCIKISYQRVIQMIEDETIDIFNENKLDGIIINPQSDHIIIK
jgi:hypothetical protein